MVRSHRRSTLSISQAICCSRPFRQPGFLLLSVRESCKQPTLQQIQAIHVMTCCPDPKLPALLLCSFATALPMRSKRCHTMPLHLQKSQPPKAPVQLLIPCTCPWPCLRPASRPVRGIGTEPVSIQKASASNKDIYVMHVCFQNPCCPQGDVAHHEMTSKPLRPICSPAALQQPTRQGDLHPIMRVM